ncbi:MAG TPA: peptidylprolyl isomerase [Bryobacteraceae bacterium]|nr:peptidylprolyl isomerase [Bryobacteraceae bacterium]
MKTALLAVSMCAAAFAQDKAAPKAAPAKPDLMNPSALNAKAPDTFKAKFTTSKGDFVVQVTRAWAPRGADRFYNLVRAGFFTDCAFFRVLREPRPFMAQFGISPKPAVAAAWERARIMDDPNKESNKRGRITFATAGANTRTTQLFINYGDNAFLDGQGFSPFGEVIEGMEVVDKFYSGYGEGAPSGRGPEQGKLQSEGKAYTDRYFPQLDHIISATIVP